MRDRYFQLSWFGEWLIALLSCMGVFGVAYHTPILNQGVWWFVLALIFITSFLRLRSSSLQTQLKRLTKKQLCFVYCLMVLFTAPLATGVLFNAANLTGIWSNS